jgi:hypothetical protein
MSAIDIGFGAASSALNANKTATNLDKTNPSNGTGVLTSFEFYFNTDSTDMYCGTFYGSGTSWTNRDYENIGNVSSGSKQTFTGKNCDVSSGDLLGFMSTTGSLCVTNSSGSGLYYCTGNQFGQGAQTYVDYSNLFGLAMYATGDYAVPTVTTQAATSVTATTCTGNGNVTNKGASATITERGICYKAGAGETPTTADTCVHDHTDATGAFTQSITGLSAGSQYSMRAYAINEAGTSYGDVVTVKTLGTVTTQDPTNTVWCGALGNGNVTNTGVSALTAKGFCYKVGDSGDPTISDSKVSTTGSSTGAFTVTIGPLEPSTSYRVRSYATNTEGTFYGDTVQITTPAMGTQGAGSGRPEFRGGNL